MSCVPKPCWVSSHRLISSRACSAPGRTSTAWWKYVSHLQHRKSCQNNGFPRAKLARHLRYAVLAAAWFEFSGKQRWEKQTGRLRQAKHQVHILHGLTCRTATEIINCGNGNGRAGPGI